MKTKLVKRILSSFSVLLLVCNSLLVLSVSSVKVQASDENVTSGLQENSSKSQIVKDLKQGKKIDFSKTLLTNNPDGIKGKYILFVKKDKVKTVTRSLSNSSYFVTKDYGEVVPVPLQFNDKVNIEDELAKLESDPNVLGISQVVKRKPFAISAPDDPKYPNGDFSSTKQWYLNAPAAGNYGIDILNAWNYLDANGKAWNGASDITVAVVDTGVAYEDFSKYGAYNLMDSPQAWDFTKSPDMTDNLFVNTNETANNQTDDDGNGFVSDTFNTIFNQPYCLDANANGQCDSPSERTKTYIDDRNGLDLTDFSNYWNPYNIISSPSCSNSPYTSYKCVLQRTCNRTSQPNYDYIGCYASDMGHPNDMMGHGTVVSNMIAGKVNNSVSGSGIASGVKILPIRIFGYQYIYDSTDARMEWALSGGDSLSTALAIQYAIDQGAKIVNMSFGGSQADTFEELVMDSAYFDHDMLLVASAGNTGNSTIQYPAGYDSVMAVGASNKNGTKASYSTYGSFIDLVAPVDNGVPVETYSCYYTGSCMGTSANPDSPSQFSSFNNSSLTSGTSFASPQVSAVAALVWTGTPSLTAQQVRYVLERSAIPIGSSFNTSVGYGVLNAYNAVRGVNSNGADITQRNFVLEGVKNQNSKVATRYSFNGGDTWSSWVESMSTSDEVSTIYNVDGNHIAQAMRSGTGLYFRNGSIQNDALVWNSWVKLGSTSSVPRLLNADGRILLSMKGTDGTAYARYSDDWGNGWSHWSSNSKTTNPINMVYYAGINRVVQAMRGTDGKVYHRYSNDKGGSWSKWYYDGISSTGEISLNMADTYIDETVRGTNGYVYMRYSKDGASTWSSWIKSSITSGDISSVYTGSRVVQFMRNGTKAYTRYSTTKGRQWSPWAYFGYTESNPNVFYDGQNGRLLLGLRGSNNSLYTRYSADSGANWAGWQKNGSATSDINFGNSVYENW